MRKTRQKRCVLVSAALATLAVTALGVGSALSAYGDQGQQYGQSRGRATKDQYGRQQQQQYGDQTQPPQRMQQGRTSAMAQGRDQQLERQVANRLRQEGLGEQGQIMVLAVGNEVILLGTVPDQNSKQQAEQIAQEVSGVQKIENRLQVQRQARRRSDTQLRQSIPQELPGNLAQNVQVQVQGGRATLQGQVDNWHDMADAISAAFAAGAQQVNSQLSISGAYAQRPYDQDSRRYDTRRGRAAQRWQRSSQNRQLEQRLTSQLQDQIRGGETITALVGGNEVFLFGRVRSEQDKKQAGDLAARLTGVERVDNNLIVAEEGWEQRDDATLQNEVRDELWWSPYVDSDDIQISVNNGVVTLSGQVADFGAMAAAIENAYEGGARIVQNRLQITERVTAADRDFDYGPGYYPPYGYAPGDEDEMQRQDREPQRQMQGQQDRGQRRQMQGQQSRMSSSRQSRDMQLEQRIASTLRQQGYGEQGEIMILATGNRVILLGNVPDQKTKSGAAQAIQQIASGQTIDNRLHVVARARRVPDSQLERTIGDRLPGNLSQAVQVQAQNGTVTLQGRLDSWTQVADAIDAAFAAGAAQVNSQFTVTEAGAAAQEDAGGYYPSYGYAPDRQRQPAPGTRGQRAGMGGQDQATSTDLRLARQVADQLRQQLPPEQNIQLIQPQSIYVTVRQGTVTLHGYVQDSSQKQQAEQIVQSIRGVRSVRNDLTILSARGPAGRTGTQSEWQGQQSAGGMGGQSRGTQARTASDRRLAQTVQQQLQDQLPDANINVTASQGTVTLQGTVQDNNQKQEAEQIAQSVRGVQDVRNNLRVSSQGQFGQRSQMGSSSQQDQSGQMGQMGGQQAGMSASDMALAQQVVQQLQQQLPDIQNVQVMRPGAIHVMATQGTITLHGFVPDNNTKQRAEQVARSISGVQNVRNALSLGAGAGGDRALGYIPPQDESGTQQYGDQQWQDQQWEDQQWEDQQDWDMGSEDEFEEDQFDEDMY